LGVAGRAGERALRCAADLPRRALRSARAAVGRVRVDVHTESAARTLTGGARDAAFSGDARLAGAAAVAAHAAVAAIALRVDADAAARALRRLARERSAVGVVLDAAVDRRAAVLLRPTATRG